jgi:hypothetical protein
MLIHALLDNKQTLGDGLAYTIYNGYFGGTSTPILDPKLNWFETATVINTGYTSDLTSLQTVTNGLYFNSISNDPNPPSNVSIKISGYFRAKKTGIYRFFTRSDDASFLFINDAMVVNNGNTHGPENQFGNINMDAGSYYKFDVYWGESTRGQWLSAGYLEPLDDGTTTNSQNIFDFITNATGIDVFYLNNYSPGGGSSSVSTLVYNNASLYGRYRISLIGLYVDRANFSSGKDNLLYISSPQLFVPGSGSRFLVIHEEPVASDFTRKDYHIFSDEFELDAELNGTIELSFFRGNINNPSNFQRALLVMQAHKI